jgi:hypothetical protein
MVADSYTAVVIEEKYGNVTWNETFWGWTVYLNRDFTNVFVSCLDENMLIINCFGKFHVQMVNNNFNVTVIDQRVNVCKMFLAVGKFKEFTNYLKEVVNREVKCPIAKG